VWSLAAAIDYIGYFHPIQTLKYTTTDEIDSNAWPKFVINRDFETCFMQTAAEETALGMDLSRARAIRAVIRWEGFPYSLQAGALLALLALAAIGWGWLTPPGVAAKLYAKSHLVTLVVWGLWWPAMIWATVLLGRVWCLVCPLELAGGLAERLGARLGIPPRPLPRWMAGGALVVLLYALLQFLVAGAQLHRVPAYPR
jgi:hypothetical protein